MNVTEEERKLYEAAKAEGLDVYTPEAFYYYYHGQNAPKGHPFTGLTYEQYIQYVRQSEAVKALTAARLQRWQREGCARELPYEAELRERAERIAAERGIPYDLAQVEAYRQLESEGLFRTREGGAVEVRPFIEVQMQDGHKIVPVPETVTEQDFAKWVYEQMKQHGAEIAWVGSQRVTFEQLKNIFEPPQPQPQPQPQSEQKFYIEVMRGFGPSEKLEVMSFEEFKKQYPQYGEREYMLYLFKTARERGYEQILTQQGWIKIPEKFEVTGMEIFTPEGIKMVSPKVFSETVESSLKSTTVGSENLAAAALKGFGVGLLRGISIGAAERIVPSIAAKPPATIQTFLPPTQPAHATAVDFTLQAETPEQKRAREAYFVHEIAAIPGQIAGSLMLSKAIETVAKLPPAEEIAQRYAAGEKITPLERVKLEAWIHSPEKVWQGLRKVGDVLTIRETKYEIPREVEANIMQLSQPQERLTYFATKIRSWQEISPELAQHLQKMSEQFGYIPVDVGGKTVKIPWHEKGMTFLRAGAERYLMIGTGEQAYGVGIYPIQFTEPGVAVTKLSGIVNVKMVESLTLGGTPKLLTEFAKTTTSFAPTFTAPSIPVKTAVSVHAAPIPALLPPEPKPVIEPKKEESIKPEVKIEIKPEEVLKIPVRIEEELKEIEKPRPFTLMRTPVKPSERVATPPLSIPTIRTDTRDAVEVAPASLTAPKVAPATATAFSTVAKTVQLQRAEPTQPSPVKPVPTPAPPSPRIPIPPLPRTPPAAPVVRRGEVREAKYWRVDWFEKPIPEFRIVLPVPVRKGKRRRKR